MTLPENGSRHRLGGPIKRPALFRAEPSQKPPTQRQGHTIKTGKSVPSDRGIPAKSHGFNVGALYGVSKVGNI